jgi:hypothetical protein
MTFQLEGTYVESCNCGVPAALGPLIGELWGEVVAPVGFRDEGGRHTLRVGEDVGVTVTDVISPGLGAVELHNVAHPVNTTLTVGEGVGSRISLLGLDDSGDGTAGFSAPFSWAA